MKRTMMILTLILTLSLTACGNASAPVATDTDLATETQLATPTELATETDTATETDAATETDTEAPAVVENTPTAEKTGTQPQTNTEPQQQQPKPQTQRTSYLPEIEPEDDEDEEMQVHVIGKITDPSTPKTEEKPAAHVHTWMPVYEEVPVYETVEHCKCHACGMWIDTLGDEGMSAHMKEHAFNGEPSGWKSDFEDVQIGTEQQLVGYVCAECGAKK